MAASSQKSILSLPCVGALVDTEGRIRISERLLEHAGIKDNVMMSGANDRIKVWAVDELDQEKKIDFETFKKACRIMSS